MPKRQRNPEDLDDRKLDMGDDAEDRDARGRFTSEGGHDDEGMDRGTGRAKSTPPKKK